MINNIGIVSLSRGILGEPFVQFEVEIGVKRLEEYGLHVTFLPNALKGLDYIQEHPEKRAEDLLAALNDPEIDMILCAVGGDDTYRLLPYLFDHGELEDAVKGSNKIFLGFSDTTVNHFMFHKAGIPTFYGQAFLPDICELNSRMHPYTRKYFEELITTGTIRTITPSDVWYEERTCFTPDQVGKPLPSHPDHGFELLQGKPVFSGKILGGCIDTIYDFFDGERYADMPGLCRQYHLFPDAEEWKGRILLLETSEETPSPAKYRQALVYLKEAGVFEAVTGVLAGKPMGETYAEEYRKLLVEVIDDPQLPIVFNLNVGHAMPRCIIPFGVEAVVDVTQQVIRFAAADAAEGSPAAADTEESSPAATGAAEGSPAADAAEGSPHGALPGDVRIRSAVPDDAEALLAIYRYYVEQTAISYEIEAPSVSEFRKRIENTLKKYPYLVLEESGVIRGYAYAGPFVARAAYDHSCALSIYLDRHAAGRGYGRALYEALEKELKTKGIRNLYACIADPIVEDEYLTKNSEQFHQHMGFVLAGTFHRCAYKFGRWYNMVWMEKII